MEKASGEVMGMLLITVNKLLLCVLELVFTIVSSLYISLCLTTFPNSKKKVENTTRRGVFLTNLVVFGDAV